MRILIPLAIAAAAFFVREWRYGITAIPNQRDQTVVFGSVDGVEYNRFYFNRVLSAIGWIGIGIAIGEQI